MLFFVSGITGHVGGAAAQQLLEQGHTVRALARDPSKAAGWSQRGVEVRQGDFNDANAVAAAMKGVDGAFLMVPPFIAPAPGFPEAKAIISSFREALRAAPPPRLVALSSIGSERSSGLGLITTTYLLEQALAEVPFPTAFVRAAGFLENYAFPFKAAAATGWFDTFLMPTDRRVHQVASEDIGKQVARLLIESWSGRKIVELGSPYSPDELALAMSEAAGREIKARAIPREKWTAVLEGHGMPRGSTGAFEEMEDGINSGWITFGAPGAERIPATITPAQFFRRLHKA